MSRAILLLTLASFGGVGLLAIVANTTDPPVVPIPELPLHAGTTVRVDGRLIDVQSYDGGFTRGLVAQSNRSVPLLARDGFTASAGDLILVEVRVLQENGRIELELEHAEDLIVLTPWREGHLPLDKVLDDPWTYRQSNLRTSGMLERDTRGVWLVARNDARILLTNVPNHAMLETVVIVDGMFTYEPTHAAFRLRVSQLVLEE
ncbi:MAG TPA: hypothetical protein VGB18_05935 [Candidatus Thermoplasmatota archaeon]